jgi:hypothetical protein
MRKPTEEDLETLLEASKRALHELEIENIGHANVTYSCFWECDKPIDEVMEELKDALRPYQQ